MHLKVTFTTQHGDSQSKRVSRAEYFVTDGSPEREDAIRELVQNRDPNARITEVTEINERIVLGG